MAGRHFTRDVLIVLTLFVAIQGAATFYQFNRSQREGPGIRYGTNLIELADKDVCPGDPINASIERRLDNPPKVVQITSSWWSVADQNTVLMDTAPRHLVVTEEVVSEIPIRYIVPDFAPGDYEVRRAAQCSGCEVDYLSIPFTIPSTCQGADS